jgi:hypothetical protein
VNDVVGLELFNQPRVRIRGVNVDFDRFIRKRFAVVLLLLKRGRKVGHHYLIVGYAVHIYGRRLVFPGLLGAGSTCRGGEIFVWSKHVKIKKMGELVKPVPRGEWGRSSQLRHVRRQMGPLPFLDSLLCLVGRGRRPRAQRPIGLVWGRNRARTTVRRLGRRQGRGSRAGRRWQGRQMGLTFDGEAAEPGAIGELSCNDEAAKPECWWGAMRGGDRSRG